MAPPAERCHANPPIDPHRPVRPPGEQADRAIARARSEGVPVSSRTAAALRAHAARLGVDTGASGWARGFGRPKPPVGFAREPL